VLQTVVTYLVDHGLKPELNRSRRSCELGVRIAFKQTLCKEERELGRILTEDRAILQEKRAGRLSDRPG